MAWKNATSKFAVKIVFSSKLEFSLPNLELISSLDDILFWGIIANLYVAIFGPIGLTWIRLYTPW